MKLDEATWIDYYKRSINETIRILILIIFHFYHCRWKFLQFRIEDIDEIILSIILKEESYERKE